MRSLKELKPQKIIVRMPNWIGDLVMATPILADLRKAYPGSHITAMCRSPICELLKEDPHIDELFCFSKVGTFTRRNERRDIIEKLRRGHHDLGILLTHSFSSAWLFWQGRVKRRLGYKGNGRLCFVTDRLPLPKNIEEQHLVVTYKMLLEPLGISVSSTLPKLYLSDKEIEEAQALLRQLGVEPGKKLVGINPGATYGSAKCWLPERFREVTQRLIEKDKDLFVVYFGDQACTSLVKEICQGMPPRVINLAGLTSLRELAALIKLCDVLLTNDSGPMHIAAALGTPLVALFGSTNEVTTGPYKTGIVIHKHVSCSPCYLRTCPIDFKCMKRIEVSEVIAAIEKNLS
ncbi:MAG: lipopolysaccharide heptosyltransferase II [Verrucomicrobia bacterium]|nr:lipopolysaccharide heptosyltransferase II [Verrucomicrobiota bacterium]